MQDSPEREPDQGGLDQYKKQFIDKIFEVQEVQEELFENSQSEQIQINKKSQKE